MNFRKLTSFSAHYILSGQHQCSQKHVPENLGNKREVQFLLVNFLFSKQISRYPVKINASFRSTLWQSLKTC